VPAAGTSADIQLLTTSQASFGGDDLLATPALLSGPGGGLDEAAAGLNGLEATPTVFRPASPKYDEPSAYFASVIALAAAADDGAGASPALPPRPASPKYDERTFFFRGSGTQPLGSAAAPPVAAQAPMPAAGDPTPPAPAPAYRHADELVRHTRHADPSTASAAATTADGAMASTPAQEGAGGSAAVQPRPPPQQQAHWGPSGGSAASPLTAAVGIQSAISPAAADSRQRSRATPSSQAGVRFKRRVAGKGEQLITLAVEVAADCRGALLPDPRYDAVRAIVLAVMLDNEEVEGEAYSARVLMFDGPLAAPGAAAEAGAATNGGHAEAVAPTPCLAVRACARELRSRASAPFSPPSLPPPLSL